MRIASVFCAILSCAHVPGNCQDGDYAALDPDTVLVEVNGHPITKRELEFEFHWRRVPDERQDSLRLQFADELVDRQLIREFLDNRRVEVPADLIDRQIEDLRRRATQSNADFDGIRDQFGFTDDSLRSYLELPLAWRLHLNRTITDGQLQEFFEEHRVRLDGTRVRASQIVLAVSNDAAESERSEAEGKMREIRDAVSSGAIEFSDAARQYSTSPSREQGGDLGLFTFHGKLPEVLATVAFQLEPGEISQPVQSEFGVHLLTVTERIPGQLSLEDVREEVFGRFSLVTWDSECVRLREEAGIDWKVDRDALESTE